MAEVGHLSITVRALGTISYRGLSFLILITERLQHSACAAEGSPRAGMNLVGRPGSGTRKLGHLFVVLSAFPALPLPVAPLSLAFWQ